MYTAMVSQDDINICPKKSISDCMCARAMNRAKPNSRISVGVTDYYMDNKLYRFPDEVSTKIRTWIIGGLIDPFSFQFGENS